MEGRLGEEAVVLKKIRRERESGKIFKGGGGGRFFFEEPRGGGSAVVDFFFDFSFLCTRMRTLASADLEQ